MLPFSFNFPDNVVSLDLPVSRAGLRRWLAPHICRQVSPAANSPGGICSFMQLYQFTSPAEKPATLRVSRVFLILTEVFRPLLTTPPTSISGRTARKAGSLLVLTWVLRVFRPSSSLHKLPSPQQTRRLDDVA